MRVNEENSWRNWERIKVLLKETFLEPHELRNESHVRVRAHTSFFKVLETLDVRSFLREDHVG